MYDYFNLLRVHLHARRLPKRDARERLHTKVCKKISISSPILPFFQTAFFSSLLLHSSPSFISTSFLYTWFHHVINDAVPFDPRLRLRLSRRFYQLGQTVFLPPLFATIPPPPPPPFPAQKVCFDILYFKFFSHVKFLFDKT